MSDYAPYEDADDCIASLTKERDELRGALVWALPALQWMCERNFVTLQECDAEDLCGLLDCQECGCILTKLHTAQRALANLNKPASGE